MPRVPFQSSPFRQCQCPGHHKSRAGGALVFVLFSVLVVAALAASFLQVSSAVSRRQAHAVDVKEAFYLAEAGLTESFAGVTVGRSGNVGTPGTPAVFGDGLFWVEATDLEDNLVRLDATGMAGTARAELSSVVGRGEVSVASLGIFSDGDLVLAPGTLIDGYNSSEKDYAELAADELEAFSGARLGANGIVELQGDVGAPTVVLGNVTSGPGSTVQSTGDVLVSGTQASAYVAYDLPGVESPDLPMAAPILHPPGAPLVLSSSKIGMEGLAVSSGAQVQIVGPAVVRLGSLVVQPKGELILDTKSGAVHLFVDNALRLEQGSSLQTTSLDPSRLSFQVAVAQGDPVALHADSSFHGVLYAPQADVELEASFEIFGSLVARNLQTIGAVRLHFDESLLASDAADALPSLVSWRILELENTPGADPGTTPFQILGLNKALLPRPAKAHQDQQLDITYLDGGGGLQTWQGLESSFDWNTVGEPLVVTRDGSDVALFETPRTVGQTTANSPAVQALVADLQAAPDSAAKAQVLIDNAPVPTVVLRTALERTSGLQSSHLKDALVANLPLSDYLLGMCLSDSPLTSAHLKEVLVDQVGNVSTAVQLGAVHSSQLTTAHLEELLLANSPLDPEVRSEAQLRQPPLSALQLASLMAVQ